MEALVSLGCLSCSKWDISIAFKTLFAYRHALSFLIWTNVLQRISKAGTEQGWRCTWLKVHMAGSQPGIPGRKYLAWHPSCGGQLNSTRPKQDLNLFFDICTERLERLCFLSSLGGKKKIKKKKSGRHKNHRGNFIKSPRRVEGRCGRIKCKWELYTVGWRRLREKVCVRQLIWSCSGFADIQCVEEGL